MQSAVSHRLVSSRLLTVIVTVILLSTVLFVIGVLIEQSPTMLVATSSSNQKAPASVSSGDPDGGHEGTPSGKPETPSTGNSPQAVSSERVFGLDLESPWFVGAFVLAWLLLGAALFRLGQLAWFALLALALVTVVLDVSEITRKMTEANTTVALIAAVVALAHVLLAALAGLVLIRGIRMRAKLASSG